MEGSFQDHASLSLDSIYLDTYLSPFLPNGGTIKRKKQLLLNKKTKMINVTTTKDTD